MFAARSAFVCVFALALAARADDFVAPALQRFVDAVLPPGTVIEQEVAVVLSITILETGLPGEITVDVSAGDPWDLAALAAARRFEFSPALENGVPVPVRVPFTYRFRPTLRRGQFITERRERRVEEATPGYRYVGRILEKGTRTPLEGIAVVVIDPNTRVEYQATTDGAGIFRVDGLPPRRVKLEVVTGEHEPVAREVEGVPLDRAPAAPESDATLYLDPVGLSDYLTVVREKAPPKAASQVTLVEDELRKTPGTFGDPTRVVQTLPGVARSPFGIGFYAVRGSSFENTGFFIDGHPVLFLYHLLGGPGVLAPELVGSLDFYPGGYPVRYGRFSTGAVLVTTKDPPTDRWHADVEIDLLKATALFSIPFDDERGQVTVSIRRSYYELLLPLVQPDISLSYLDYQARVNYAIKPNLRWRFSALGAEDAFGQGGEVGDNGEEQDSLFILGFHRLLTGLTWDAPDNVKVETSLAWEYDRNNTERTSEDDDSITADFAGWFVGLRVDVDWRALPNLTVSGGFDGQFADLGANLRVPSLPPIGDPRPPAFDPIIITSRVEGPFTSTDPWVSADWEVIPGLRLIPGFRLALMTYGDESLRVGPDPRLSVRWAVAQGLTLTAMGSIAHESPQPFQYAEPYGDPEAPLVQGVQGSFGMEWVPEPGWLLKLEGFYNHLYNMIRPNASAGASDSGDLAQSFWSYDMQGRGYGLEVFLRKEYGGRHYGWVSYTLSRSERLRPPADWTLYEQDQTHNLNVAWSVILGRDWSVGARFSLTSGNFYYPIEDARYDADRDSYEPVYGEQSFRFDVFHRLDLRVDKRWRFDTWMLEAYLDIQNVYNADNPEAQRYSFDYRVLTAGPGLPILPTIGVRGVF